MNEKELSKQFGSHPDLDFRCQGDGIIIVDVHNRHANASISLQGAQVINWTPADETPVIWLSGKSDYMPGKSMRGGVPVCWPWFGPHATDALLPAHGFARTQIWNLVSAGTQDDDSTCLVFELQQSETTQQLWPYAFSLRIHMTIGNSLDMRLETMNLDSQAFTITEALHTYFQVSDVRHVSIVGLEDCHYLDKVDAFREKMQSGRIMIDGEVDRVYLDTLKDCAIEDPGLNRKIVISKSGSQSTVVWNPWKEKSGLMKDMEDHDYLEMLCVESANAARNHVLVDAGDTHSLSINYHVEKL